MPTTAHTPLGHYLPDYVRSNIENGSNTQLDGNGVIQVNQAGGWQYNPVTISQYGLQQYGYWLDTANATNLNKARIQADYLVAEQDAQGEWQYPFNFSVGNFGKSLFTPWASAMAQGQAMSLLVRMNDADPDPSYITATHDAMNPLEVDVASGGLTADFMGVPGYLEEYPTDPSSHTLNGFIFTLVGLYDAKNLLEDRAQRLRAMRLYNNGRGALRRSLPWHDFDDRLSAYHLGHVMNPPRAPHTDAGYHSIHVIQLDYLNDWDADPLIAFYEDKWRAAA